MKQLITSFILLFFLGCSSQPVQEPYVVVLGIAQDGGAPHAGCQKDCCRDRWITPGKRLMVVSLGIVDPNSNETWMIEATPDFPQQLEMLTGNDREKLNGIFLTHAHIGHYTGLIHLGREVMETKGVSVYAMPKMAKFLESNGPWRQLVDLKNIKIEKLKNGRKVDLNKRISITPFLVPHRDEFSETVGYRIEGPNKSLVFIPDIDKWEKWEKDIVKIVSENDYSLIDGSFYTDDELPGRNMSEIPHPFMIESMQVLKNIKDKTGIHFIHLNHTNPALNPELDAQNQIKKAGFQLAHKNQIIKL
ncbi:MAG: MBL fold metallo-hydrolase [Candidatus Marinimicrobia bacterium]|nr:MBL fold metallo-hydrolase [Candidatus Neomarinimicrobiota bacterium]